jgi:hypothetical protein
VTYALTYAVVAGPVLIAAGLIVAAAVYECSHEIDGVLAASDFRREQAIARAHALLAEQLAADEDMDRQLRARWGPIDQDEADLWARQLLAPDSDDRIHAEAMEGLS